MPSPNVDLHHTLDEIDDYNLFTEGSHDSKLESTITQLSNKPKPNGVGGIGLREPPIQVVVLYVRRGAPMLLIVVSIEPTEEHEIRLYREHAIVTT